MGALEVVQGPFSRTSPPPSTVKIAPSTAGAMGYSTSTSPPPQPIAVAAEGTPYPTDLTAAVPAVDGAPPRRRHDPTPGETTERCE